MELIQKQNSDTQQDRQSQADRQLQRLPKAIAGCLVLGCCLMTAVVFWGCAPASYFERTASGGQEEWVVEADDVDAGAAQESADTAVQGMSGEPDSRANGLQRSADEPASQAGTSQEAANGSDSRAAADSAKSGICAQISGAVQHPGVYELPEGSRVVALVEAAGGLRKNAYDLDLNQAAFLADGEKIHVPTKKEARSQAGEAKDNGNPASGLGEANDSAPAPESATGSGLVDLNTATKEELMTLPGIGEARAAEILAYREKSGRFRAIEEIKQVSGIGEGLFARFRDQITVT